MDKAANHQTLLGLPKGLPIEIDTGNFVKTFILAGLNLFEMVLPCHIFFDPSSQVACLTWAPIHEKKLPSHDPK